MKVGTKNRDFSSYSSKIIFYHQTKHLIHKAIIKISVNCREKSGKRKLLERDDGTKVCYLVKKFPSSRKSYERSKTFCKSKGGVLVEIKGPKDQQNVVDMLMEVGSGTAVKLKT